ncbi:MAG: hypothetical protein WC702_02240 [Patescibacteria group bacterium]|jgi:hypothetical protein
MKSLILPTVTSTLLSKDGLGGWREKVKEIDQLGLKQVAVFVTTIGFEERQELFHALENTKLEEIPFVHIRSDMRPEELEYLIKRWQTKAFNFHLLSEFGMEHDLTKYYQQIYIENTFAPITEEDLKGFAGLCLDFSHVEDARRFFPDTFKQWQEIYSRFPIGCGHISAVREEPHFDEREQSFRCSYHWFNNLTDFDYLKNVSLSQVPPFIALELENPLVEQLKVKEYVEKILVAIKP